MSSTLQKSKAKALEGGGGWGRETESVWEDLWALDALEAMVADRGEKKEYRVRVYTGDKKGDGVAPVAYINLIGDKVCWWVWPEPIYVAGRNGV